MKSNNSIASIVVTYNTDSNALKALLEILSNETLAIIVDNSIDPKLSQAIEYQAKLFDAIYLSMKGNAGVGAAQNVGVRIAKSNGCKFVLLMDDDSLPSDGMIACLMQYQLSTGQNNGKNVIVCARPVNVNSAMDYDLPDVNAMSLCTEMMSSGSLIPIHAFDIVSSFDETLFVDFVDYDWGWRAIACGFRIYIIRDAILFHKLGEGDKRIFGISLRIPSPIRHYFQVRNCLGLWRKNYVSTKWKLRRLLITPIKFLLVLAVEGQRASRIMYFSRGLLDGFRGVNGSYPND